MPRSYRLHLPPTVSQRPRPLVIVLAGFLQPTAELEQATGWDSLADARGAVVAYPEAVSASWDAGTCCGLAAAQHVDDIAFLRAVVADLTARWLVDPRQVFLAGFSNGAMMVYRVLCQAPDLAVGYGIVAGSRQVADCHADRPVKVTVVHGDSDRTVPLAGQVTSPLLPGGTLGLRQSVAAVVAGPGCQPPLPEALPVGPPLRIACASGLTVHVVVLPGVQHVWPHGQDGGPDATALLWQTWH